VSLPTVRLHFGTKEQLLAAAAARFRPGEMASRATPPGDVETAVRVLCNRYEVLGPATLRFHALEETSPVLAQLLEDARADHHRWVVRTFAATIAEADSRAARVRRTMQLVAAMDLATWQVLRRRLGPEDTIRAMTDTVRAVVGARRRPARGGHR